MNNWPWTPETEPFQLFDHKAAGDIQTGYTQTIFK